MRKPIFNALIVLFAAALFCAAGISTARVSAQGAVIPDLTGTWIGYYDDGTKSPYVWSIDQTGATIYIQNVGGQKAKSRGRVEGNKVVAEEFATQNGTLSTDGAKITWSDGVVWKRLDLSGTWVGYYDDGSKSPYVWSIRQKGSTLAIENVGGDPARSNGRLAGFKVVAEDFATKDGTLSNDGTKITWKDRVVWVKQ